MEFKLSMALKMYKIRVFKELSCTAVAETRGIRYNEKGRPLA